MGLSLRILTVRRHVRRDSREDYDRMSTRTVETATRTEVRLQVQGTTVSNHFVLPTFPSHNKSTMRPTERKSTKQGRPSQMTPIDVLPDDVLLEWLLFG